MRGGDGGAGTGRRRRGGAIPGGKAQDRPRRPLALPISRRASGIFSSRRIERATRRDLGMRCGAANPLPDHDTLAAFRHTRPRRRPA
ncbi:hypothetical protein GCM10010964_06510 [Caldovatus sediminis]|uniref:Uncharacterized protein n=1 Tax=Caldovatus sediminis TaxID=2041189 RepID=A0A8J3EA18_9PROT|nr:hypothetical protein GCM10010964_06510 [Caldovatus sediminis]